MDDESSTERGDGAAGTPSEAPTEPPIEAPADDGAVIGAALRLAVGRIARRLRQTHTVGDITPSEASVLARLGRDGADSPGSLAELERVRPQAMATTIAALLERGLVRRTPDAADGRRFVVSVSEEGEKVLLGRRSESVQRLAAVLDGQFTPAERDLLASVVPLLDRLAERL